MWEVGGCVGFYVFIFGADWAIPPPTPCIVHVRTYFGVKRVEEWGGGGERPCPPFHHEGRFSSIKRVAR